MSTLRLEYEVLVSGIYPFEGEFEKCGFKIVKKKIEESYYNDLRETEIIYMSPLLGMCSYPDSTGNPVYLTMRKEEVVEYDYGDAKEYDLALTNEFLTSQNFMENIDKLEKTMVLEVNNDIKFPIKRIKVYDSKGNYITMFAQFMKLNVPCLISKNPSQILEVVKRQNNRLNSGLAYEKVIELANVNSYYNNALTMYHSSFSVSDYKVGFILLVTTLEALVSLSTYEKPEKCECCDQPKYKIRSSVSENVGAFLMDESGDIQRKIKKLYDKRSRFLHSGIQDITKQDEQEMQEFVRKVLLMYWCVSMNKKTYNHKEIMAEIKSTEYKTNIIYRNFLVGLDNISFNEKRTKMLKETINHIFGNIQ